MVKMEVGERNMSEKNGGLIEVDKFGEGIEVKEGVNENEWIRGLKKERGV